MSRNDMPQDSRLPADPYHYVPRQPQGVAVHGSLAVSNRPVYARQVLFGDDVTRAAHLRRCRAIQQTMRTAYEVAPLHRVVLPSGHTLIPGDPVRESHFVHETEGRSPTLIIDRLVQMGAVLRADVPPDDEPAAA